MADQDSLKHLIINGYSKTGEYISPKQNIPKLPKIRDRTVHGSRIKAHLERIKEEFESLREVELPEGIVRDDAIYVEFISEYNFALAFDSLNSDAKNPKYQLLSIKEENTQDGYRYRVNVMLTEGGISHFLTRVNE